MGFLNKKPIIKAEGFHPIDLNEGNVQAIFNRCLTSNDNAPYLISDVFSPLLGYEAGNARLFDKEAVLKNKQTIRYLFGQLAGVHEGKKSLTKSDFLMSYRNIRWTENDKLCWICSIWEGATKLMRFFHSAKKTMILL